MSNFRAQGSIEYLLILGAVILVSAVVVLMLSGLPFNAPLKSVPFVSDAFTKLATSFSGGINVSGNGPIVINTGFIDPSGDAVLSLLNNSGGNLFVNKIVGTSGGNTSSASFGGITVPNGGTVNFPLNGSENICECSGGVPQVQCTYTIHFTNASGQEVSQTIIVPMTCPMPLSFSTPSVWVEDSGGTVSKLNLNGAELSTISDVQGAPMSIAVDSDGNVWVANFYGDSVSKLNSALGTIAFTIPIEGSTPRPSGIAVDKDSNVWVANSGSGSVFKVSSLGVPLGTYYTGNPFGIAIDAENNVWVTNYLSGTVSKFNSSGDSLLNPPVNVGSLPRGIAIDAVGNVWVANNGSGTVSKLNSFGVLLNTIDVGMGLVGVAVDAENNVWVATSSGVSKINSATLQVESFESGLESYGIAVDSENNVWVTNDSGITKLNSSGTVIHTFLFGNGYSFGDMTGFALQYFVLHRR